MTAPLAMSLTGRAPGSFEWAVAELDRLRGDRPRARRRLDADDRTVLILGFDRPRKISGLSGLTVEDLLATDWEVHG
jgi:hypothetical protein